MRVPKDFKELLVLLREKEVRALIVGGWAFSYHARPRATKDLDIWIEPTPENVARLLQALDEFGFGSVGLTAEDFLEPGRFVQLGYPPSRVNLLTTLKGVSFKEAWERRIEDFLDDDQEIKVAILGKEELMINKKIVGRPQDQADVAFLESLSSPSESL